MFSPGVCRGSLSRVSTSPVWSTGCFWLLRAGSCPVGPLRSLASSHSGVCVVRVGVPPLVPSLTAACLGLWPYDLAIAALLLVSRPWTGLCWSHLMSLSSVSDRSWCYRASWLAQALCSPASTFCPTSSVVERSSFGLSASASRQVFAMRSPFQVESVSVLDRNEVSSSTFLEFGWSLRDEVTLSGRVCLRSRSKQKTLRAPSLVVGAEPSRWGHPYRVVCRFSAHSIGTKAASVQLSLVASRWGHPAGQVCFLPLDRNEVYFGYLVGITSGWGHPCRVWI